MPSDTHNNNPLAKKNGSIILKLFGISLSIALLTIAVTVWISIYREVPVNIWGINIGHQVEQNPTNDIPFLVTEVQQLKEQRKLLEKRLIKLLDENDLQKKLLKECEG